MRSELQPALTLAREIPTEELLRFLGDIEEVRATALGRLAAPAAAARPDELLDVSEAAQRLGVSPDYLYRHSRQFPFTRRMGRKLLFSSAGLDNYLRRAR